jgi:two-component system OmpR family sensor kinase
LSIRTRLAALATLVLAITIAVFGVLLVRETRATMVDQVDDQLRGYVSKGEEKGYGGRREPHGGQGPPPEEEEESNYPAPPVRLFAEGVVSADGVVDWQEYTGYTFDPDPPPALPDFNSEDWEHCVGRIVTLSATDGSRDFRVYVRQSDGGDYLVTATSLASIDATVSRLQRAVLVAGAIALAVSALTIWWLIRRGLRPVDRMVDTAAAIAAGDLSRRVPIKERSSELGRLGVALNEMLVQIERAIRQRQASEDRLRRFVADAAHELRTPLTALRGYTELYRSGGLPNDEAVGNAMRRIEGESVRLARLVEDMLLLARLDNERGLEMEPTDVVDVVRDAIADFQAIDPERPVSADLAPAAPVVADRVRLRQVIDNLLVNTRVHTPPGTPVHVAVRRDERQVDVVVADEGPGISQADQARVFERFWRADPSRVRRTGGTGLGLAIVNSLVQAHGGTVELDSAPGRGARFTVRLPLAQGATG